MHKPMQPNQSDRNYGVVRWHLGFPRKLPLLARFLGKIVHDILPTALASVIGGFLFTQYQFGHSAAPPATVAVVPASAEMMALVRDEHAVIVDYLKTQMAAEKSRFAAADTDASGTTSATASDARAADAKVAAEPATRHIAAVSAAAKVASPRAKVATAATVPHAPLVIAQTEQIEAVTPADRLARDPDSLLAKTLDVKDQVFAATRRVVFAIGDMFASVGGRLVGPASARQFNDAS
jgi:hypothetical protein